MTQDPAMDGEARRELSARIEQALRAQEGVRGVYRSGSLISNLIRAGAAALSGTREGEPIVSVASGPGGVAVEASLGVDADAASGEVLRDAYAAVDAVLAAHGRERESITLVVAYVQAPRAVEGRGAAERVGVEPR